MAKGSVEITGINTNDIPVVSSKEMKRLFTEYKDGSIKAKELLVYGNMKLVLSILKKYKGKYDNMDDLFQIGMIGLIKAVDNFDLSHNVKFSTYAVPMVDGEIKRYIRDNNLLRVSRSIKEKAYRILKYTDEFVNVNGREPTTDEIVKNLSISEYDVSLSVGCLKEPMSIYDPIYNDGGDEIYLIDQLEDKRSSTSNEEILNLRKAISKLNKREKNILISRYVIGKTQMEIASSLGISQAQVSRLEKSAIKNVRKLTL